MAHLGALTALSVPVSALETTQIERRTASVIDCPSDNRYERLAQPKQGVRSVVNERTSSACLELAQADVAGAEPPNTPQVLIYGVHRLVASGSPPFAKSCRVGPAFRARFCSAGMAGRGHDRERHAHREPRQELGPVRPAEPPTSPNRL